MKKLFFILGPCLIIFLIGNVAQAHYLFLEKKFIFGNVKVKNGAECNDEFNGYTPEERREIYQKIATPLEKELTTYTWGSSYYVQEAIAENFSNRFFYTIFPTSVGPGQGEKQMAGRGVYSAKDLGSSQKYGVSQEYCRKSDCGGVVEIVLKKGSLFLDINQPQTLMKLRKLEKQFGLPNLKAVLFDIISIDPKITIRFHRKPWYVIKTNENIEAREFSGTNYSLVDLLNFYKQMHFPKSKRIVIDQIKTHFDTITSPLNSPQVAYKKTSELIPFIEEKLSLKKGQYSDYFFRRIRQLDDITLLKHRSITNPTGFKIILTNPGIELSEETGRFSANSHYDTVCQMMGFSKSIENEIKNIPNDKNSPTMFVDASKFDIEKDPSKNIINQLSCEL